MPNILVQHHNRTVAKQAAHDTKVGEKAVAEDRAKNPVPVEPAGPSDFETLASALTAIYGGRTSPAPSTVPTAVVPVNGEDSSGMNLRPLIILAVVGAALYFGYRWWKRHRQGNS